MGVRTKMKIVKEWEYEPRGAPKVYFNRDIYYRFARTIMRIKFDNAAGLTCYLISPYNEVLLSRKIARFSLGFFLYTVVYGDPVGLYTAELRQNSNVVASDTAELRELPTCELDEKYCLHGDLWRCIDGKMQLYQEHSPQCIREGFSNTGVTVPDVLRLQEGIWDIMITKEWYVDKTFKNIKIEKGKTIEIIMNLTPKPKGALSVGSTPKGARIWVKQKE